MLTQARGADPSAFIAGRILLAMAGDGEPKLTELPLNDHAHARAAAATMVLGRIFRVGIRPKAFSELL